MRILLVEDDDRIAKPLVEDLEHQHHVVDTVQDGLQGWEYAQASDYDLILLDLMLPKLDGISLCKRLRESGYTGYILMLTAKDTTADKVKGLDAGADDYLVKPFELEELEARLRALLRRSAESKPTILKWGDLQLNPVSCEVTYQGGLVPLTPKEYTILELLMRHPTYTYSRSAIIDKLWGFDRSPGEDAVKTHIKGLRQKLKAAGLEPEIIETVYGMGYRLQQQPSSPKPHD